MIQIYSPDNTDFEKNGDMTLLPEECKATSELGGSWVLEITHPIDDEGRWKYIEREAVLSVPTFMGEKQLYRIDEITDKSFGKISAKAYPIFFDSADDHFLLDTRPTGATGQEALDAMTKGSKYSGKSDITEAHTAYFIRRNLMNAIGGDESPTFLETWGGEVLYDNYKVIINKRAGGDYGVEIRYGKNLESVSAKEDMSEVVTRIAPVAFNGRTHSENYIDSPLIEKYAKKYIKEIKFEDVKLIDDVEENEDTDGLIVCQNQEELDRALKEKCQEQFDAGIDLYKLTMEISVVELENTEEYKDFKDLVKIGLGDTVSCHNSKLGIDTKARAIKIAWDCIKNEVEDVTLGDYQRDILKDISNTMSKVENITNANGSVNAEKIQGVINAINAQLKYQKNAAQKQDVRAILFEDMDERSELYGALAIGTQGIQIANKRTTDGRNWDWTTAITANGIIANAILTGMIADKTGKNYWDLDAGRLQISNGEMKIAGQKIFKAEDYTENDLDICQEINIGLRDLTPEYLEKYDFDGKGYTNAQDLIKIRKILNGTEKEYRLDTSVEINALDKNGVIRTLGVLIGTKGLFAENVSTNRLRVKGKSLYESVIEDLPDCVIEQGSDGIWEYRKWKSGIAECWGAYTTTINAKNTWGQVYTHDGCFEPQTYPFSFVEVPVVQCTPISTGGWNFWVYTGGGNSALTEATPYFSAARGSTMGGTNAEATVYYSVKGRWK